MGGDSADRQSIWPRSKFNKPSNVSGVGQDILEIMESGLILTPVVIADNLDKNRSMINRELTKLVESGVVERIDRGKYKLNFEGYRLAKHRFTLRHRSGGYTIRNYENEVFLDEFGISLHGYHGEVEREATRIRQRTNLQPEEAIQRAEKNVRIQWEMDELESRWRDKTREE